jgi:hypothetical protein
MPIYEITSPEGKKYRVTSPEGATKEDALAHIQQQTQIPQSRGNISVDIQHPENLSPEDIQAFKEEVGANAPPPEVEKPPLNRFLSGVGGEVLKSASNIPLLPESVRGTLGGYGEQGLESATGTAGEVGKFVGSTAPYMALPAGGVLKTAALSGGLSGLTSEGDAEERAIEAAKTAGGSAAIGGLAKGLRGFTPSKEAAQMMQEGIQPTVGQGIDKSGVFGKTVGKVEEAIKSVPLLGMAATAARERGANEWLKNIYKKVEIPELGVKADGAIGHEAIGNLNKGFNTAYNSILKDTQIKRTPALSQSVDEIVKTQPDIQKVVEKELSTLGTDMTVNADDLHRVISSLRDKGFIYSKSPSAAEHFQGEALRDVASSLRQYLGNRLPPEKLSELNKIDSKYGSFKTLQRASTMLGAEEGKISGSQLLNAVKAMDKTKDKSAFAKGEARLQKEAIAAKKVFGDTLAESGTTPRMIAASAIGGGTAAYNPATLAIIPAGVAGSIRPAQKALLGGYSGQKRLSDFLRKTMQPATAGALNEE